MAQRERERGSSSGSASRRRKRLRCCEDAPLLAPRAVEQEAPKLVSSSGSSVAPQQQLNSDAAHYRLAPYVVQANTNSSMEPPAITVNGDTIRLNVGGELFVVQRETLLGLRSRRKEDRSDESFFVQLLNEEAAVPSDVDETGAILVDRDPMSFSVVLNYLRGYENALVVPNGLAEMVAQDAEYYHLVGLQEVLKAKPQQPLLFCPGPGVNPECTRFKPTYAINFVGDRFLLRGRHSIVFEVLRAEYLGIGVVSDLCIARDVEFHKTPNCCVYYMTGVFYSNFPSLRKEEMLERYGPNDHVALHLDMDAKTLTYEFHGATKLVSIKSASRLRFAVALRNNSSVRVLKYTSS